MNNPAALVSAWRTPLLGLIGCSLVACGGSSLDSDDQTPVPLVLVNAGANQSVNEGSTVTLSGEASGQTEPLTYSWSVSPNLPIIDEDSANAEATFVAPQTTEVLRYTFTLVVTDADGNSGTDNVTYEVQPVNAEPIAQVRVTRPTTVVGGNYPAGIEVTLDASGSTDADAPQDGDAIADYRWQQTEGASVLQGVSLDGATLAFTTPILDDSSTLTFELTVTDQEGAQNTANISLPVLSASQTVPVVDAGIAHQVYPGEQILLAGTATTTIPAARPLSYLWLNDSQLEPQVDNANALQTFAVAPLVDTETLVTFTLTVTDTFGNEVDDSVRIRVKPLPLSALNDTGVSQQASTSAVGTGFEVDYPGQDGQRGPDIIHQNGLSEKAGRGDLGFDFTRLNSIGDEVDESGVAWSCVRDNVTGLVWEVKTAGTDLHGARHTYTWYHTEDNGDFDGVQLPATASCATTPCNTSNFVTAVNSQGLCNFYDWRIPTHNELLSLIHFGRTVAPLIDTEYFPAITNGLTSSVWYWTRIPSADGVSAGARNAWAIDMITGNDNFINKGTPARILLVRGGR